MARQPRNHGKEWDRQDDRQLKELAKGNTPTGLIAWELGRTEAAVYSHASEIGLSLRPTNQSPYNRKGR